MSSMKMKLAAQKKEAHKKHVAANPGKSDATKNPIAAARRMAQQSRSKGGNPEDQIQQLLMQMFQESYKKYLEDIKDTEEKPMPFEQFSQLAYAQMMQMAQQQQGGLEGLDSEAFGNLPIGEEAAGEAEDEAQTAEAEAPVEAVEAAAAAAEQE